MTKNDKIDTLFKTKILKNIHRLAAHLIKPLYSPYTPWGWHQTMLVSLWDIRENLLGRW